MQITCTVALAMLAIGCGSNRHVLPSVARPPSRAADGSTASAEAASAEPVPPSTPLYARHAPGVWTREGEAEGLGYLEVVLGDVDPESELPLVVVIHGRGDRPGIPDGPFEGLPRAVRVIAPRGPIMVGEGFGWLPVVVADGRTELLAAALHDVGARLARFIGALRAERRTRGATIVTGFSQGGMLAITIAVQHPEVTGAAFVLAGWLPPPLWPLEPAPRGAPPVRAMHALDDPRIPYAATVESYERLRSLGWDLELSSFDGVGHAMSPEMDAGFHAWLARALDAIANGESSLVEPAAVTVAVEVTAPEVTAREAQPREALRRASRRSQ